MCMAKSLSVDTFPSENQHGVAEAVKAIAGGDSCLICLSDKFLPGEGGHHHEQGGAGQVKISNHGVNDAEAVSRQDAQVYLPGKRRQGVSTGLGGLLDDSDGGGADADNTATFLLS